VEVCSETEAWWREAAGALEFGKLLTFDYGFTMEQIFAPERRNGTLRAYRHHRLAGDVLADPGLQDLTAQVNFSTLRAAGEAAGLTTECFELQAQFLSRIAFRQGAEAQRGLMDNERARQFHTLTHPDHLGRAFRVLAQSRDL